MQFTPQDFVSKWSKAELKERSSAQEHFIDLCRLVGHPTPAEADPTGQTYAFEAGASKQRGGQGYADVWKKGYFAWEYKGKHKDLDKAYQQLLQYRESLHNPPLLVVTDIDQILVHTNFTNTAKRVHRIELEEILTPDGMAQLRAVFFEPRTFRAPVTTDQVTAEAATHFAKLADLLRAAGGEPQQAAHFLIRLLFCLFAEDIQLLPKGIFMRLVQQTRRHPDAFAAQLRLLFSAMSTGGWFGADPIRHFDGRLFDDDTVLTLDRDALDILAEVATLDWESIEPSVFGTLFERTLDPAKRSQLGAHYTSREDILLIVEPVLMAPLRRRWEEVQSQAQALTLQRDQADTKRKRDNRHKELAKLLLDFSAEIAAVRVLDPACGSGNFLYVALRQLLDLEKEVVTLAGDLGVGRFIPSVSPSQVHGIEINSYAHQLAQATIWIGYIQWLYENGFGTPSTPILKPLDQILHMDAILTYDDDCQPVEPEWPPADIIIGNPPFLGGKRMRAELGDDYVDDLFALYDGGVPHEADLVCYWFERARALIERGVISRAGLLATQAIRGGTNRAILEQIKATGDIFWAQSDRNWILDGATVHVSMVGFDRGREKERMLDQKEVNSINPDLTSEVNVTLAVSLQENAGISFMGITPAGPFAISGDVARSMLADSGNPNRRPNSDVVRTYYNGTDLNRRPRDVWIIDFGVNMLQESASEYEGRFEYVRRNVKPMREKSRVPARTPWWHYTRTRPAMRAALGRLSRFIGTSMVSKHHIFCWIPQHVLAANLIIVIAREDDYFMGCVHSAMHELWARRTGTQLREADSGSRYTPTSTFETYPFPWPPGSEPRDDPYVEAIAQAARELVEKRDAWLNPPGAIEKELKKRTLTNLYNQRPTWLDLTHRKLDQAVFDAYGWPHDLTDEGILERLLALNLERAGG